MADQNAEQGNEGENTSTISSLSDENEEQGIGNAQGGPVNHNEPMHDEGPRQSGYGHNPVLYRRVSVNPHPAGNAIDRPQFYHGRGMVRAPTVTIRPSAQIPAADGVVPNAVQTGNIYHQEHSSGSLPPQNANHRIPGRGMVHHVARSHHIGGSLNPGHINSWPGMSINPGVMHQTNPRANSLSSNARVPQHQPQQLFSVSYSRGPSLGHYQHARPSSSTAGLSSNRFVPDPTSSSRPSSSTAGLSSNRFIPDPTSSSRPSSSTAGLSSNRFISDPTSSSRPSSSTHAGLSSVDQARFSRMSSRNTSLARLPNEQNPLEPQHGHENINRVLPIVPSPINMQNQPGYEMRREPVGLNCNFCNGDLRDALTTIKFEPPFHPEVAVFSCGHACHTECFRRAVGQEQSADTPRYFCTLHRP